MVNLCLKIIAGVKSKNSLEGNIQIPSQSVATIAEYSTTVFLYYLFLLIYTKMCHLGVDIMQTSEQERTRLPLTSRL